MLPHRSCLIAALTSICATAVAHPTLKNYKLDDVLWRLSVEFQQQAIAGNVTNRITLTEPSSEVQFDAAAMEISDVTVNGSKAHFEAAHDLLTVDLPHAGSAGQSYSIAITYSAHPRRGFYFVTAERAFPAHTPMVYTQGEGEDNHYWLPTYDFPDNKATSECYVTVPKDWTAISNGALLDVSASGSSHTFHWKMDKPYSTYLISLAAGPYSKGGDTWHGMPVDYYVPPGLEAEGRASFLVTSRMIDFYSKLTGFPYPWPKFAQDVVGDFMYGGMENVSAVTQTIKTLHPANTEPLRDSTYLVAHELAHHWFGDTITCATWEHMWLNEGFATTLPAFYTEATRGEDEFVYNRYSNFESAINSIGSRHRRAMDIPIGSAPNPSIGSAYDGGCSRILMLYHLLGKAKFWGGISTFLKTYEFQPVTTAQFFESMSKSSGVDLTPFERQWFYTPFTPSVTASVEGSDLVLTQLAPYYSLSVPVWFLDGNSWEKKSIVLDGPTARLPLGTLAGKPYLVDPEAWTLMELSYANPVSPSDFKTLYAHAPNVAAKARLIASFYSGLPLADRAELASKETFHSLLQLMAANIGPEGEGILHMLAGNKDPRVVDAALSALDKPNPSDKTLSLLQNLAKSSSNEAIREHATRLWLNASGSSDFARKVWTQKAFDDGYREMALNWFGRHEPNTARELALAEIASPGSEPVREAAIRVLGIVKEAPGSEDVFKALLRVAQENSYGGTVAAIRSLAELGNADALPVLQDLAEHGSGGVSGTAKAAIESLTKK